MDRLSVEMLHKLCSYFSVEELETTISKISRTWLTIAEAAILFRVAKMGEIVTPETRQEIVTEFIPPQPTPLMMLKKYESLTFVNGFKLLNFVRDHGWTTLSRIFHASNDVPVDDLLVVNEAVKFIPCYQMVVILAANQLFFIHEKTLFENGEYILPLQHERPFLHHIVEVREKYTASSASSGFKTGTEVALMDVFHDHIIVCPLNVRYSCLYKVATVCHSTRTVTLNLVHQIFFPSTIDALRLYRQKVIVVLSTGDVGIWQRVTAENTADLEFSQGNKICPIYAKMFRINNLILIQSVGETYDLVDAESEGVEVSRIPLIELLSSVLPVYEDEEFAYNEANVHQICITGNMLLVQILVPHVAYDSEACPWKLSLLCALKLRKCPAKDDFTSVNQFKKLVNLEDSKVYDNLSSTFLMIPPSIVPRRGEGVKRAKVSLMTISSGYEVGVMDCVECPTQVDPEYTYVEPYIPGASD